MIGGFVVAVFQVPLILGDRLKEGRRRRRKNLLELLQEETTVSRSRVEAGKKGQIGVLSVALAAKW